MVKPQTHKIIIKLIINWLLILLFALNIIPANAVQQKPLRIILDWFVNPNHAPLFVAQQQHYYQDNGLKVEFITPADPADGPKLVAAGKADIAITYEPKYLHEQFNKLPLTEVGVLIATPLDTVMALKDSNIQSIADLKGKRIGYSGATGHLALKIMLQQNHLSLKDIQLINVHYALSQALLSRRVDAVSSVMRNFEPKEVELAGKAVRLFYVEEHGMPLYSEEIFVVNSAAQNDPRIKLFLQSVRQGTVYLINHPQQCWKIFAKNHPELNNELNKSAWFATLPHFALRPTLIDREAQQSLQKILEK